MDDLPHSVAVTSFVGGHVTMTQWKLSKLTATELHLISPGGVVARFRLKGAPVGGRVHNIGFTPGEKYLIDDCARLPFVAESHRRFKAE